MGKVGGEKEKGKQRVENERIREKRGEGVWWGGGDRAACLQNCGREGRTKSLRLGWGGGIEVID